MRASIVNVSTTSWRWASSALLRVLMSMWTSGFHSPPNTAGDFGDSNDTSLM